MLAYKADAAGIASTQRYKAHPLQFLNYKDHQKYDCAITRFDLKRSASHPMLYSYTIHMRAYNLRDLNDGNFEDLELDKRLEALGLNGVDGGLFKDIKQTSNGAKDLINGGGGIGG